MNSLSLSIPGNLGVDAGSASDGVLLGSITPAAVGAAIIASKAAASGLVVYTYDGGLYADDSTDFSDAGAADVQPLPNTPANNDAFYIGAAAPFAQVDFDVGTAGDGSWTYAWEYWDGSDFTALSGVVDETDGFQGGSTGIQSLTFTLPGDWEQNTVDASVLKYWIRLRVVAFTSIVTPAVLDQGFVILEDAVLTDDTTDANDAGTTDVAVTSAYPAIGDRFYIGSLSKFAKVKLDVGTAATGTLTFTVKYWDGSAWSALTINDPTSDFSAAAGVYFVSFKPPADWATTTVDAFTGYFVAWEVATASGATAPALDQAWVLPLTAAAAAGLTIPSGTTAWSITRAFLNALTASATNDDTVLLLCNVTTGVTRAITWTGGTVALDVTLSPLTVNAGDELVLLQVAEDGTTEFADANVILMGA